MDSSRSLAFALALAATTSALVVGSVACTATITTVTNNPDRGTTTTLPDGSVVPNDASVGILGFNPSNLGAALATVDTSKLVDVDVSTQGAYAELACGIQPNDGCVTVNFTQSDGSSAVAFVAKSWKIEPTVDMDVRATIPVVLVALTTIDVLGGINVTADIQTTRGGGFGTGTGDVAGSGPGGGAKGDSSTSSAEGPIGGGGGGHCGAGGKGGRATASVGIGGTTYGNATLIPLQGGSGGGNGLAGAGGGALQLVAGTSITIAAGGKVHAGGGGGASNTQGSSGGGAGGALLLEAPTVTVEGNLAANGGGAGGGSSQGGSANGANASADGIPAPGGNPGTSGGGGNGSAAATLTGSDGSIGGGVYGAAGGGGGAGWIRINTRSGVAAVTGAVSPSLTTTCATQGTLR